MEENISFIGLGKMGTPMARNLLQKGFSVWVYNRSAGKSEELEKEGARLLQYPGEALEKASCVITMLSNDQALEDMVFGSNGLGEKLKKGKIHISMSSISPQISKQLTQYHREKGAEFISAPVFGRPDAASEKKLWILLAGHPEAKKKVMPFLESMGQKVFDFGEEPEKVNLIKLAGNFMILSAIEAMGEAFSFLEKAGINASEVAEVFNQSMFACPVYQGYSQTITKGNYEPGGFSTFLGLKDLHLFLESADAAMIPLPLANLLHDRLVANIAKGRKNLDWSAIALGAMEEGGML